MPRALLERLAIGLAIALFATLCLATSAIAEEGPDPMGWKIKFKNGIRFERNDGMHKFQIGGRTFLDFAAITSNDRLKIALGFDPDGTGVEFRTARIYVSGVNYKHIFWKTQIDFGNGDVKFKDVYIGLKDLPVIGDVLFGHQKEPFGLEQMGSSRFMTFMERASPDHFVPSRNIGLVAAKGWLGNRIRLAGGGFADSKDGKLQISGTGKYSLTGRLTGAPIYANDGRQAMHLGVSYSHQWHNPSRYAQRPARSRAAPRSCPSISSAASNLV